MIIIITATMSIILTMMMLATIVVVVWPKQMSGEQPISGCQYVEINSVVGPGLKFRLHIFSAPVWLMDSLCANQWHIIKYYPSTLVCPVRLSIILIYSAHKLSELTSSPCHSPASRQHIKRQLVQTIDMATDTCNPDVYAHGIYKPYHMIYIHT